MSFRRKRESSDGGNAWNFETIEPNRAAPRKAARTLSCSLQERVQPPSQGFHDFRKSAAPSVEKPILALRQKIFGPPAPLVAVLAQRFVILPKASHQGFHGLEFSLDSADTREERRLLFGLGRRRCVRHGWMIARKGYRSLNTL